MRPCHLTLNNMTKVKSCWYLLLGRIVHCVFLVFVLGALKTDLKAAEINGLVQFNYVQADGSSSWLDAGSNILVYSENGFNLQQGIVQVSDDLASGLSYDLVANFYSSGEKHLGMTQAQVVYKPLSNSIIRWKGRVGVFYPSMSLENVELGWLSPFSYTQSAINSWIGEEVRTPGLELSLFSPGRARYSPFSWEVNIGAFKGNDPAGAIITWRGFALHDRQSFFNERIPIAPYPTVIASDGLNHPDYVEPFHEFDGRTGFYLGAHLDFFNQSSFRYYYYDNQADENQVNNEGIYGWRTRFHSIALQHKTAGNSRIIAQWLSGDTIMGKRFVAANFEAWFLMFSHVREEHRWSVRYDQFKVNEDDIFPWDANNSDGKALTLAWRYNLTTAWQVGLEQHINRNTVASRVSLGQEPRVSQRQTLAVLQYRW